MKKFFAKFLLLLIATSLSSCVQQYVDQFGRPIPPHVAMRAMSARQPCPPRHQPLGGVQSVVPYRPFVTSDGYPLMQGTSRSGHTFYRDPTGRGYQDLSSGGPNRTGRLIYVYY